MLVKFETKFIIPHFLLSLSKEESGNDQSSFDCLEMTQDKDRNAFLRIGFENINPKPITTEDDESFSMLIGQPIINETIQSQHVLENLFKNGNLDKNLVKELNGEFLVINLNKSDGKLTVINDRFASFPFYYGFEKKSGKFFGSLYFSDIWSEFKKLGNTTINETACLEFLYFQRLLGSKTYLQDVSFLADASILEITNDNVNIERYWQRDYTKNRRSLSENADLMASLVRQSIKRKTSDGKRYGLFLSGGMDSRTVLSGFEDNPPVCFTSTLSENREYNVARSLAEAKGTKHVGLELDPEHYSKILKPSVQVSGGMYNYDHGLFYGFNDVVQENADVCFHGHGFDYMFQGMYIPAKRKRFMGRNLYLRTMIDLPDDLVSYFIDNVSYRIKNADLKKYISPEKIELLRKSVSEILEEGKKLTNNKTNLWEFLTFHHLSRHYSYPNHASIATFAEQRTISFDNDLFDFYLSMPIKQRFDGKIEKECLKRLSPELAKIWSANTNLPVTASCMKQTVYQIAIALKKQLTGKAEPDEQKEERTWPLREGAIRDQKALGDAVLNIINSDVFDIIPFLDTKKLKDELPRWIDGEDIPEMSGDLVQTLLTIGTFFKQN